MESKESYERWIRTKNGRAYKAKQLRYKKAALRTLNMEDISDELYAINSECDEIRYFMSDDDTLLDAMDGDDDEAYEFKMLFSDLSGKCEQLYEAIHDNYVNEHFNDFMVGILGNRYNCIGYDGFMEDYYALTGYEGDMAQNESGKRIMRLTKEETLSVAGQCFGIAISFLDVRHSYDYLKSSFCILKETNISILQVIKDIEVMYEKAAADEFYLSSESTKQFDYLVACLPDEVWLSA